MQNILFQFLFDIVFYKWKLNISLHLRRDDNAVVAAVAAAYFWHQSYNRILLVAFAFKFCNCCTFNMFNILKTYFSSSSFLVYSTGCQITKICNKNHKQTISVPPLLPLSFTLSLFSSLMIYFSLALFYVFNQLFIIENKTYAYMCVCLCVYG